VVRHQRSSGGHAPGRASRGDRNVSTAAAACSGSCSAGAVAASRAPFLPWTKHTANPSHALHLLTLLDRLTKHMTASALLASASALMTPLAGVKVVSTSSNTRLKITSHAAQNPL
jgi:hypothetical protein